MRAIIVSVKKHWPVLLIPLAIAGIFDSLYLTIEHYRGVIPPCGTGFFIDCGKVLTSQYSEIFGVPLALIGVVQYTLEAIALSFAYLTKKRIWQTGAVILAAVGFFASVYFVFLMVFVIGALCKYCMVSALVSTTLFFTVLLAYPRGRTSLVSFVTKLLYQWIGKPILFQIDPEKVHMSMTSTGKFMGDIPLARQTLSFGYRVCDTRLVQTLAGIKFSNPVGLAAGFDYEANLTQILGSLGFGFQSVGTITNLPYGGNPRPMLGRLPNSQSLMVNKGFKNLGAPATIKKLEGLFFPIPVGISIGRTNHRDLSTQKKSIADIIRAFELFEDSRVRHAYYELNISCPNLFGNVSFYPANNLKELLVEIKKLRLTRPLFVKMPINEDNRSQLAMMKVIANYSPAGVIYGNLQKDRKYPSLDPREVAKFDKGYFSGKPCFDRSNELISLAQKHFKDRFVIIGCGGIFSAEDAYEKIRRGASLVQLITGMIYQGPQLISQINNNLLERLWQDDLQNVSEAIGIG